MDDLKFCYKCKTAKERSEFNKKTRSKDGLQNECKTCKNVFRVAYYKKHSDKERIACKAWQDAHPDKSAAIGGKSLAIKRGGSASDIYDIELCIPFYAEARRLSRETGILHHVDHIIPLSKGGLHCQTNLQVLTATENIKKGNRDVCQT